MALINCPECGKEVSDKAENCIHCGYVLKKKKDNKKNKPIVTLIMGLIIIILTVLFLFSILSKNDAVDSEQIVENTETTEEVILGYLEEAKCQEAYDVAKVEENMDLMKTSHYESIVYEGMNVLMDLSDNPSTVKISKISVYDGISEKDYSDTYSKIEDYDEILNNAKNGIAIIFDYSEEMKGDTVPLRRLIMYRDGDYNGFGVRFKNVADVSRYDNSLWAESTDLTYSTRISIVENQLIDVSGKIDLLRVLENFENNKYLNVSEVEK